MAEKIKSEVKFKKADEKGWFIKELLTVHKVDISE